MKNYFFEASTSVLFLTALAWAPLLGIAAEHVERVVVDHGHVDHGHVEYSHGAGVGSVHFAPREFPVHEVPLRAGPVVRAEEHATAVEEHAVRAGEHIAAEAVHAAYRNPYRDDYFRRFPPGYHPYVLNGAQYYGYYSPPVGCQQVVLNGINYFLFGGVYYRPYMYGGQTVYLVVPAPVG